MFFQSWDGIWRIIIVGTIAYATLIALLRLSGKRTLSKMNAFDLVVTVSLGSTLATILLSKDVPLAEGATALALLIALQMSVAWTSVRLKWFSKLVKSQPALLFYRGEPLNAALKTERVTEEEIRAAIRAEGISDTEDALAVVLETDGTFTVLKGDGNGSASSLKGVSNVPPGAARR